MKGKIIQLNFKKQNGSGCFLFRSDTESGRRIGYCAINLKEVYRSRENLFGAEYFISIPVIAMHAEYEKVDSSILNQAWMVEVSKVKDVFPEQWNNSNAEVIVTKKGFFISMKLSDKTVFTSTAISFKSPMC